MIIDIQYWPAELLPKVADRLVYQGKGESEPGRIIITEVFVRNMVNMIIFRNSSTCKELFELSDINLMGRQRRFKIYQKIPCISLNIHHIHQKEWV